MEGESLGLLDVVEDVLGALLTEAAGVTVLGLAHGRVRELFESESVEVTDVGDPSGVVESGEGGLGEAVDV